MHDLDAGEQDAGAAQRLEADHRSGNAFDCAVVLLDEVVEVFRLAHLDVQTAVGLDARDCSRVRAALVDGDLLGHAVQVYGALEECPGCGVVWLGAQQEVNGVAVAVDRPLQLPPLAADLHVGLVHPPTQADWALAPTRVVLRQAIKFRALARYAHCAR